MRTTEHIKDFIHSLIHWAATKPDIKAIALAGSYAREAASQTSDIDLIVIADEPRIYLEDTSWLKHFGTVARQQVEDYGLVKSVRVWFSDHREVEFGLTTTMWVNEPLDAGTSRTIQDGLQVLFEREPWLSPLIAHHPSIEIRGK